MAPDSNALRADRWPAVAAPASLHRPLRVCHVMSADLWAGAEVQVATTAAFLAAQPDISLSLVLLNNGRLAEEVRRLGVRVTVVDETRTSALGILRWLTRRFRIDPVDIVHTHRYKDTVLGATAARLAGVPVVVRTVHGLPEPARGWAALRMRIYGALERAALIRMADGVIAVSTHTADALRDAGLRPTLVSCIHNGIEPVSVAPGTRARTRRALGLNPAALVIGTAGRLVPVKDHAALLRAMAFVLAEVPTARLLVVGDGPLRAALTMLARQLGISDACLFTGHRDNVPDLLAAMDVFALSSVGEGIPMALLEAMSIGLPVVSTRVGGVPEVVEDRVTGLLVDRGDDAALAQACLALAADPAGAARLGRAARLVADHEFSHDRAGRALLNTYRYLALPSPSGRPGPRAVTHRGRRGFVAPNVVARTVEMVAGPATRAAARGLARAQARAMRRSPDALRDALRSARSVLMVCYGNIVRSPFAASLLRHVLGRSTR